VAISILIADDHGLVRAGLRLILGCEPNFEVVGEADNGYAAFKLVDTLKPSVLLADISMPGLTGIQLAAKLCEAGSATRVIIVSMHDDVATIRAALEAGAAGYVPKRALEAELCKAISVVSCGGRYVAAGLRAGDQDTVLRPA
jgi:DNA-binding NarL/FixJ family response regulator